MSQRESLVPDPYGVAVIGPRELRAYLAHHREEEFALIDVREPEEYAAGHLPGALLVGSNPEALDHLTHLQHRDCIFYCLTGQRAEQVARGARARLGLKRPFVLGGGLAAWTGQQLRGAPRLAAFATTASLDDVLERAIGLEKGADRLYASLVGRTGHEGIARLLSGLVESERAHARAIYGLWRHQVVTFTLRDTLDRPKDSGVDPEPEVPSFEEVYERAPSDLLEDGSSVEEVLEQLDADADSESVELLELALDIELRAYDLYRTLAHRADTHEQRRVLLELAEQEKAHVRVVARCLAEVSLLLPYSADLRHG